MIMDKIKTIGTGLAGLGTSLASAEIPEIVNVNVSTVVEAVVQIIIAVATIVSLFKKKKIINLKFQNYGTN